MTEQLGLDLPPPAADADDLARRIAEGDVRGAAGVLQASLRAHLKRELTSQEWLQCYVAMHMARVRFLVPLAERARREKGEQEAEEVRAAQVAVEGADHWLHRYERCGVVYTLDYMRHFDRRPTNPMAGRRGRVLATRGEWVTVEWRETNGLGLAYALEAGHAGKPFERDELWRHLTVFGHSAWFTSDIPGVFYGRRLEDFDFDPNTGIITNRHKEPLGEKTRRYRPTEPYDVRRFAPPARQAGAA